MFSATHSLDAKKCQYICKTLKHLNVKKVITETKYFDHI